MGVKKSSNLSFLLAAEAGLSRLPALGGTGLGGSFSLVRTEHSLGRFLSNIIE